MAGLDFHHVEPYAVGGGATVANIQLRCRAHNAYEARLFFGDLARESRTPWGRELVPERVRHVKPAYPIMCGSIAEIVAFD